MLAGAWIIDDEGEIWPEADPSLAHRMGSARHGETLTHYLVAQLGFVSIRVESKTQKIVFNSKTVAKFALMGALRWVAGTPFRPTGVFDSEGSHSLVALVKSQEKLVSHLGRLIDGDQSTRSDYRAKPTDVGGTPFARQWKAAKEICLRVDSATNRRILLDKLFDGLFTVSTLNCETGFFEVTELGNFAQYDEDLPNRIIGRSFDATYDKSYGQANAKHFRSFAELTDVMAEHVTANIEWPSRSLRTHQYFRLLVPFQSLPGTRSLLSATLEV